MPREVTDATQMTLFTAEGLLRWRPGTDPAPALRHAYVRWLRTQRRREPPPDDDSWLAGQQFLYAVRAPGTACLRGLDQQLRGPRTPHRLGKPGPLNPDSKGCGAVMRSAPFGLAGFGPDMAFAFAGRCAQLTHGHPTGYLAAAALAALLDRVLNGTELTVAVRDTIAQLTELTGAQETVAGNLLGVTHGLSALPTEWVTAVEGHATILRVADDLVANFFLRDRTALGGRYPFED